MLKLIGGLAYVTAEEMKDIDGSAIQYYGIDVASLMENAGLATALLARHMCGGVFRSKRIACLTGKGNNGGDGLVAARHLHNWGAEMTVVLSSGREDLGEAVKRNLATAEALGVPVSGPDAPLEGLDLLLDALLGYSSKGPPREPMASLILRANASNVPILAVDIPSGMDPDTGFPYEPCIRAEATITLGLPKTGFLNPGSASNAGALYLGDVSLPRESYLKTGADPPFAGERFIRVRRQWETPAKAPENPA